MDGLEVCRKIRAGAQTPILMLTARGDAMDRVVGLEIGADDYLPKPFEPRELSARLRAILRRSKGGEEKYELMRFGRLEIDVGAGREVLLDAVDRGRGRCAQEPRSELLAMRTIVHPIARGGDPLAGGNSCGMADHGHHFAMPARFCSQNAEAVLGVVVGDALDEAGQHLLG